MSDTATIHLPALGNVKKTYVYVGGGILVAGLGWYWWHQRSAASAAAAAAASTDASTPADNAPIDTATGYPTGSAQDLAALAQQNAAIGASDGTGDTTDTGDGGGGYISSEPTTGGFTSNGTWAQAAETYLTETAGADPTTVAAALGKYISGQAMTTDQTTVAQQAIAFEGYPPVSGSDGYPPSIRATPVATTPTPTAPAVPPAPANMRLLESSPTTIRIGWNTAVGGASIYHVYQGSTQIGTVYGTFYEISGLKANTKYGPYTVRAANSAGQLGPASNPLTVTTPK